MSSTVRTNPFDNLTVSKYFCRSAPFTGCGLSRLMKVSVYVALSAVAMYLSVPPAIALPLRMDLMASSVLRGAVFSFRDEERGLLRSRFVYPAIFHHDCAHFLSAS